MLEFSLKDTKSSGGRKRATNSAKVTKTKVLYTKLLYPLFESQNSSQESL